MALCECPKDRSACLSMTAIFTLFYIFVLWGTYPVDKGFFNFVAYLMGAILIVLWYVVLTCKKSKH